MIHQSTAIDLFPITVFVGSNNGGKSALFDALLNFSMVSRGRLSQAFGPGPYSYAMRRHRAASPTARIRFVADLSMSPDDPRTLRYLISYSGHGGYESPSYTIHDERLERTDSPEVLFDRADQDNSTLPSAVKHLTDERSLLAAIRASHVAGEADEADDLVAHIATEISRMNKFRLIPFNLAKPSRLPEIDPDDPEARMPRIDWGGEDLAAVLYYLTETDSALMPLIIDRIQGVLAGFDGFEFNTVGTDRIGFSARFSDARGVVPAVNLSDGTLSLIGMLVLLLSSARPPVLFLEEPENGLTPRSTRAVYETICEVTGAAATPRSQVLMSSHSPFVICEAWNGDERDFIYQVKVKDGSSQVRRFVDIIDDQGTHLGKVGGERDRLSFNNANAVMDGYNS